MQTPRRWTYRLKGPSFWRLRLIGVGGNKCRFRRVSARRCRSANSRTRRVRSWESTSPQISCHSCADALSDVRQAEKCMAIGNLLFTSVASCSPALPVVFSPASVEKAKRQCGIDLLGCREWVARWTLKQKCTKNKKINVGRFYPAHWCSHGILIMTQI